MFPIHSLAFWVPRAIWLAAVGVAAGAAIIGFRKRPLSLIGVLVVLSLQAAILGCWMLGITAATTFNAGRLDAEHNILDPSVEKVCMFVFWLGSLLVYGRVLTRVFRRAKDRVCLVDATRTNRAARIACMTMMLLIHGAMFSDMANFRRMWTTSLAGSTSPDGRREVSLVPMNCLIDTNGLVIWRYSDEWWWHPIGHVGDQLTFARSARFQWPSGSSAAEMILEEDSPEARRVYALDFEANWMESSGQTLPD